MQRKSTAEIQTQAAVEINPGPRFMGVDPGLDGGIVILDQHGAIVRKWLVPCLTLKKEKAKGKVGTKRLLDTVALNAIMIEARGFNPHTVLEQVSARPGQGVASVFTFGRSYGILEGLLVAHQFRYEMCVPAKWTKVIHAGVEGGLEPKAKSRIALNRLFPAVDLRASEASRTPHEGLMDALLIAEWARRVALQGGG